MKQLLTTGIILTRTDYGEADRILNLLTPEFGKLHLLAKGVRRVKSKLAGGIELFSVSHITFIKGRSDLGTLISTQLIKHYGTIVKDITRTMTGYELIKQLNRATEDNPEVDYFHLLQRAFEALDDPTIELPVVQTWFSMQLLRLGGHTPNLQTDMVGAKLQSDQIYAFSLDDMTFTPAPQGSFTANHIKFLRLGFGSGATPKALNNIKNNQSLVELTAPIIQAMVQTFIRI